MVDLLQYSCITDHRKVYVKMKELKGTYLLVLISVCGITAAALGMLTNVSGLFFSPISEELGTSRGSVSLTLTISNLVSAVGGIVTAKHVRGSNFKRVLILSAIVYAGCTVLLSICSSLFPLYLFNAVRGFAAGVSGNVMVTMMITNWFYTGTGLITSIAMGFSGIAGAVFSPILSSIIQSAGWRVAYIVDGIVVLLMYLPAILLKIGLRPDDLAMDPMGYSERQEMAAEASSGPKPIDRRLLLLCFAFSILVALISSFPPHMPSVAVSFGFSAAVGSAMLSVMLIANTGGKLLFGVLADKIGTKRSILLYGTIFAVATVLLLLVHVAGLMVPFAVLFGVVYTMPTVALVLFVRDTFGAEQYAATYPKIAMSMTIVNAFGTTIIGYIYDLTGGYTVSLIICLIVVILAMLTTLVTYRKTKKAA